MKQVDRANFVDDNPYMDTPQSIGYGVTISAPHMVCNGTATLKFTIHRRNTYSFHLLPQHAYALELLQEKLVDGEKALDVGSGSGYLTACMALLVGPTGKAIGIDHIPRLVDKSVENVRKDKPELLEAERVKLVGEFRAGLVSCSNCCVCCELYV